MTLSILSPISAGDSTTWMPAARRALILSSAPPFPPEMMAPAWPIRRPGGAVRPAMKPTTGLSSLLSKIHCAASSSAEPPISPIRMIPSVSGSFANRSRQSMKFVPLKGSPPIPTHVDCPSPVAVVCPTASYVRVPERETIPIFPGRWICPGIIPILHSPGLIIPGQLGPIRRVLLWPSKRFFTVTISFCGIPSVMQTTSGISASIAS
mmetsp:Transcript_30637/g.85814  ORF Transcript_30637/g.85814 Transcript_30637/m.85814 type:complete len:208 (+) Transcript_30637:141-764(+)